MVETMYCKDLKPGTKVWCWWHHRSMWFVERKIYLPPKIKLTGEFTNEPRYIYRFEDVAGVPFDMTAKDVRGLKLYSDYCKEREA